MSDKRIIEYETATTLADDDYILLDSETGGTCKIKAKKLQPPLPNRITATYTQTITVKDNDSLDVLRQDLVVKAYYDDGVVETVSNYTLSGTLEVGTSTITASYKGFSDSFDVTVETSIEYLYKWDFTQSLTDEIQGVTATLSAATFTQGTGVYIEYVNGQIALNISGSIFGFGRTIEIDFGGMDKQGTSDGYVFSWYGTTGFYYRNSNSDWVVKSGNAVRSYTKTSNNANVFSNKTLKMVLTNNTQSTYGELKVYSDDVLIYEGEGFGESNRAIYIGSSNSYGGTWLYTFINMTITGVRIYETPTGGN